MRTAPEVVGRIKRILAGTAASPEEVRTLAQEYLELCLTAQRRLEECGNLLGRGLRSEAIYAAEASPPLLEQMGILEFPDAPEWCEFARQKKLPAPVPFDSNLQKLLEDEWGQQNDVEPLINQYRKLCVGRAPASQRIALLRRLRSADPANPNWPRDLELLEANRFKEIRLALRAPSPPTEDAVARYVEELTSPDLVTPAPQDLVELAQRIRSRAAARRFDAAIRQIAGSVHDAYAAMDLDAVESNLVRFSAQCRDDGLPIPMEVAESLNSAREWAVGRRREIERQRQFEQACAELDGMLASAAGTPAKRAAPIAQMLHEALARLEASGGGVPPDLSDRTHATIATLLRRQRSRRRLRWLAAAAALALFITAAATGTRYVLDRRDRIAIAGQIEEIAARIDDFTGKYDFTAGHEYVARVRAEHPSLSDAAPFQQAVSRLDRAATADNARAAELSEVLRKARELPADDAGFAALIERATQLARTQPDREGVATARDAARAAEAQRQRAVDDRMAALLQRATAADDDVQAAREPALIRQRAATMAALMQQADAIAGASSQRREELAGLRKRYGAELSRAETIENQGRREVESRREMLRRIEQARQKLPDVQAYATACETLHTDYPSAPEVFRPGPWKALVPYYTAVVQASASATESHRRNLPVPAGNPPGSAVAGFRAALAAHSFTGESPYQPTLAAMTARARFLADSDKPTADLRDLLAHRLISAVNQFTVQKTDESPVRYYTPENERVTADGAFVRFNYFDDQHRLKDANIAVKLVKAPQLAPHCVLAREISRRLRLEQESGDWASAIPGMMDYALTFHDANPRVRALILKELTKVNDAAGNPAALAAGTAKAILDLSPDYVNFLTPDNDLKVTATLADIDRRTTELAARLSPSLKAAATGQTSNRADVAALYRPLVVSATIGNDPTGNPIVVPVGPGPGGKPWREFWAIAVRDGLPVFTIAAVRRDGAADEAPTVIWVKGTPPLPPGQPLLSPGDDADTATFAAAYGLSTAAAAARPGWPVNLLDVQPPPK